MTEQIVIEPFSERYGEKIFDLIVPIQTEEFGVQITKEDQPDLARIPFYYQRGNGNFWVAVAQGDAVVGTVALLDIGNNQVGLRKMFVRADFRGAGKGVARALLDTAIVWAREHGISDVFLGTTAKFLAAHRFYEKSGFEEVAMEALPPAFPVMTVDTKFYRLRVANL